MARQSTLARFEVSGEILGEDMIGQLTAFECRLPGGQRAERDLLSAWELLSEEWQLHRHHLASYGTDRLRRRWISPFLETFEFTLAYQKAHIQFGDKQSIPITYVTDDGVPIWILDYGQSPDDKIVTGKKQRSPHEVFQDYLDNSEEVNWGIICNGKSIRLLHDYHKTLTRNFVEADLESIFDANDVDAFRAVWRIFHNDGFKPGNDGKPPIERLRDYSRQEGAEVGKELRYQVVEALKILGNGFLATDPNGELLSKLRSDETNVATTEFYQALLRIVYRLLFLFYIENKPGWTPAANPIWASSYGISRLREQAEEETSARSNSEDHWEGLKVVFDLIRCGNEFFHIHAYGGELFNDDRLWLLACKPLRNSDLLAAIRRLTSFERDRQPYRVNFRTLRIEALGSVYEALLDVAPIVTEDGVFEFGPGTERKLSGSYYTPSSLVGRLIKSTVLPVIEDRLRNAPSTQEQEIALLSIRIVDPACGSGHFLLAATDALAARLCYIWLQGEEPSDLNIREARRAVVQNCIFGVDVRPMAVELCKFGLWLHVAHPDFPLSYLEPHILLGNSLIGVPLAKQVETAKAQIDADRARLTVEGEHVKAERLKYVGWPSAIPTDAYDAVADDDKTGSKRVKGINAKFTITGQRTIAIEATFGSLEERRKRVGESRRRVMLASETTDEDMLRKDRMWAEHRQSKVYIEDRLAADLWCAAFFWHLNKDADANVPTTEYVKRIGSDVLSCDQLPPAMASELARILEVVRPFHWELEFPEIFEAGGFDCVIGNPPWERIKLQEQEFFASRAPAIAKAANRAVRQKMIVALEQEKPELLGAFHIAKHAAEAESKFIRKSGRFPLTAVGDVNTYALFAEHFRTLLSPAGRAGVIVPTGIATDDTTKVFFRDLVANRSLESYFGFKNERFLFQKPVEHTVTFGLLTMLGANLQTEQMEFCWLAYSVDEMEELSRRIVLTVEDIALFNPNTLTCPVFRTDVDADLARYIYRRVPPLVDENRRLNAWRIRPVRVFDMNKRDVISAALRLDQLLGVNEVLMDWGRFTINDEKYLPVLESKLMHQYNHRYATYADCSMERQSKGQPREVTTHELSDAFFYPVPRYWLPENAYPNSMKFMTKQRWLIGYRNFARSTDERTFIASILPFTATDFPLRILGTDQSPAACSALVANLNSISFDYTVRQKVGATDMSTFILKQLPVIPLLAYSDEDYQFITQRVLELTYTCWDLQAFAQDLGYVGPPYPWDEGRRAVLAAELDAYYARLYGLTRKQLRYILDPGGLSDKELADILDPWEDPTCAGPHLTPADPAATFPGETFRVLKNRETADLGEYRTRRLILSAWAQLEAELGPAEPKNYHELVVKSAQTENILKYSTPKRALPLAAEARPEYRLTPSAADDDQPSLPLIADSTNIDPVNMDSSPEPLLNSNDLQSAPVAYNAEGTALTHNKSRNAVTVILTIGYGNRPVDAFFDLLKKYDVTHLIDIRTSPYSRFMPDYNREAIQLSCKSNGIRYVFRGDKLGGRPENPSCYDDEGHVLYDAVQETDLFKEGIAELERAADNNRVRVCLMCSELKPSDCHRSKLVGRYLTAIGKSVYHISESSDLIDQPTVMQRVIGEQLPLFDDPLRSRKPYRNKHE